MDNNISGKSTKEKVILFIKHNIDISNKSTKEEVAEFFKNNFRASEDVSNNFIKEYISGDILPILSDHDLESLGLNFDLINTWMQYYYKNMDKFKENEVKEEISSNSTSEEVKIFLESYLDFKENIDLNGKLLFGLNEEEMKKLAMKLGQRKKLIKYINKINMNKNKVETNMTVTKKSSVEEVANFLMNKLKLSKQTIEKLLLDGKALFDIEEDYIDKLDIPISEKGILKKFTVFKQNYFHFNIFMIICSQENFLKEKNFSFYFMKANDKKIFCEYNILHQGKSDQIYKSQICDLFLIKIDLGILADKLYMTFKNEKNEEYNGYIYIKKNIEMNDYFCFSNFNFGKSDLLKNKIINLSIDTIFNEFSRYF